MAPLRDHLSDKFVKMFYVGHSGSGKTGSLASLVAAGYKLRIIDFDNGVLPLRNFIEHTCPEKIDLVDVETLRDLWTPGPAGPILRAPKAFVKAVKLCDKWSDGSTPATWGEDTIFVLDSITHYSRAAFDFAASLNPQYKEQRLHYGNAQKLIFDQLSSIMAQEFQAHVILISHIDIRDTPDGAVKGFVSTIGEALGPKLPSICNTLVLAQTIGQGASVKRTISTLPTALMDLKNPAPFRVQATYPLDTGMASLFSDLRGLS